MPGDRRTLDLFAADTLPEGFRYQSDFVSSGEERSLLRQIEPLPFREFEFQGFTGKRRVVSYGGAMISTAGASPRRRICRGFLAIST